MILYRYYTDTTPILHRYYTDTTLIGTTPVLHHIKTKYDNSMAWQSLFFFSFFIPKTNSGIGGRGRAYLETFSFTYGGKE